jgi:hypothetical protein
MEELLVSVLQPLLALIPVDKVEFALACAAALSLLLIPAKAAAARAPAHWRPWLDGLFKFLDLLAANTRGLHTRPVKPAKKS